MSKYTLKLEKIDKNPAAKNTLYKLQGNEMAVHQR